MKNTRLPAVAGLFYPDNARELGHEIEYYLSMADDAWHSATRPPKALIVPHAGYIYSGAVAAKAYALLATSAQSIKRVVLLGPAHRTYFQDLATTSMDYFRTPLGDIAIDKLKVQELLRLADVQVMESAHQLEHSLEVQLPFLQTVLGEFSLIPIVVGDASGSQVHRALELLWGGPETLIVISSDLSHYQSYDLAQSIDRSTSEAIEQISLVPINSQQACGCTGINGLLQAAKQHHLRVKTLQVCNSGDVTGEKDTVVGYGSWAFLETERHVEQL